jgi:hypothetical protein
MDNSAGGGQFCCSSQAFNCLDETHLHWEGKHLLHSHSTNIAPISSKSTLGDNMYVPTFKRHPSREHFSGKKDVDTILLKNWGKALECLTEVTALRASVGG